MVGNNSAIWRRAYGIAGASLLLAGTTLNALEFNGRAVAQKLSSAQLVALPKPEVAKALALGFDAFIADMYWIGAVHYLGENRYLEIHYAQLTEYIDIITTLAPDLHEAYWFGGVAAPWNTGKEWVNVDDAVRTLEHGIQRFPDDWRMRMVLAYDYSAYQHRYKDAAGQLEVAARIPGAPRYLAGLATRLYVTAGDVDGALAIANRLFESSDDPTLKDSMRQRARELREFEDVGKLKAAVASFREQHHRLPDSLDELQTSGLLQSVPLDPGGGTYEYNSHTGEVGSKYLQGPLTIFGAE